MLKYNNIIKLKTSQLFHARVHLGHHINKFKYVSLHVWNST